MSAPSPLNGAEGVINVGLLCNGHDMAASVEIRSVTVRRAINRVPTATLVLQDGDMPMQQFPLSDGDSFATGAEVHVQAGYGDDRQTVFKGIVVKHAVTVSGDNDSRLTLECHDKAFQLTVGQHNRVWTDQADSEVLSALAQAHGLTAAVDATTVQHPMLVQHGCSDWDFLLSRAGANGLVVMAEDGRLTVSAPALDAEPVLSVSWGIDIMDFQAELDARHPQGADPARQALTGVQGHVRFQGSARARLGTLVALKGVGTRFSRPVLTTALTHELRDGTWTTEVAFGQAAAWATEPSGIATPAVAGCVPGIDGLHVGVVVRLDADPQQQHRVQVKVPSAGMEAVWARLAQPMASKGFGTFFVPEVGDEVLLGWFHNDPSCPVVLGGLHSSQHPPPYALEAGNPTKAIVTRCGARLEFNDADGRITLVTPNQNKVVISDKDQRITLTDQNHNQVELAPGGITLDSPKDIRISAKGKITLDAVGEVAIASKADVQVAGLNVHCSATVGFAGKGAATAELSASGQTTVKGALVMIN